MSTKFFYIKDVKVREGIIKFKMYRVFSYVFFIAGFITFLMLYSAHMDGREAMSIFSFETIAIILLPFMPAFVLSIIALRAEKAADIALELYLGEVAQKKDAKATPQSGRPENAPKGEPNKNEPAAPQEKPFSEAGSAKKE
jgi:hypothetical protein|tara:strand:+ start:5212 stop:5634 length:423 start_codon:yes stop_codon:yes gene_type:complete